MKRATLEQRKAFAVQLAAEDYWRRRASIVAHQSLGGVAGSMEAVLAGQRRSRPRCACDVFAARDGYCRNCRPVSA